MWQWTRVRNINAWQGTRSFHNFCPHDRRHRDWCVWDRSCRIRPQRATVLTAAKVSRCDGKFRFAASIGRHGRYRVGTRSCRRPHGGAAAAHAIVRPNMPNERRMQETACTVWHGMQHTSHTHAPCTVHHAQQERHTMRHALCSMPPCHDACTRLPMQVERPLCTARTRRQCPVCLPLPRKHHAWVPRAAARPDLRGPLSIVHQWQCVYGVRRVRVGCCAVRQMCGVWCMHHQALVWGRPSAACGPTRPVAPRRMAPAGHQLSIRSMSASHRSSGW